MPTEHWLTAWTKICSATFLLWTLKWRKYFPEICLTEGILCDGLSNTLSTEDYACFYQEPTRKTPQWRFVPCLEASRLFQSVAGASRSSLMMKGFCGIFWSLFSLFVMFSKLRASENEEVTKPVPHYLYTHPTGFSVRSNTSTLELLVMSVPISSILTLADLFLKGKRLAQGLRRCGKTSGWVLW